jgi:hypothetical protein
LLFLVQLMRRLLLSLLFALTAWPALAQTAILSQTIGGTNPGNQGYELRVVFQPSAGSATAGTILTMTTENGSSGGTFNADLVTACKATGVGTSNCTSTPVTLCGNGSLGSAFQVPATARSTATCGPATNPMPSFTTSDYLVICIKVSPSGNQGNVGMVSGVAQNTYYRNTGTDCTSTTGATSVFSGFDLGVETVSATFASGGGAARSQSMLLMGVGQ